MKFQANVPFKLTKMFYEKLGEQPTDKRILVIRDFFTAMHASIDNAVTFVTDDKEAYELFSKNVVSNDEFGNDDTALFVDTEINKNAWKDFIKELSSMPKFDVAIMNPPYDKNLHLKILEAVIPIADKVVNISPNDFYTNPYSMFEKDKQKREAKEKIATKIVSEQYITPIEFNQLFNTNWSGAVSIMLFDKDSTTHIDISKYESKNKLLTKIIDKITKLPSIRSKFTREIGKNYVLIRRTNHRYLNWCEDYNRNIKAVEGINFENDREEQNFRKSFNTWFYKFLNTTDWPGAANSAEIPYMQDYTQPWDDKRFCEYFGITGYISDTEAEPGSEWEIILNTMKEYV